MPETKEALPIPQHENHPTIPSPEQGPRPEKKRDVAQQRETVVQSRPQATPVHQSAPAVQTKDPEIVEIETILAEGMEEFFLSLSPAKQHEFKSTGEAAAVKIKQTLQKGGAKLQDIVSIIVGWLRTLPGLNKFFLEQEAKIKADKILHSHKPT